MRRSTIYNEMYRTKIHFILSSDAQDLKKICKDKDFQGYEVGGYYGYHFAMYENGAINAYIWVSDKNQDKCGQIGTLSHEALHAVRFIMSQLDTALTKDSEEMFCYLLAWIVKNFSKIILEA